MSAEIPPSGTGGSASTGGDVVAFLDAVEPLVERLRLPYVTDSAHREAANALDVLVAGWRKVLALCAEALAERPDAEWAVKIRAVDLRAALVEAASPTRGGTDVPVS